MTNEKDFKMRNDKWKMRNEREKKGEKEDFIGENEVFWRKREKSCRKIWWNEKKVLPLHSLLRTKRLGSYQSGQMGQTVNLLAMPSVVQIHHHPLFPKQLKKYWIRFLLLGFGFFVFMFLSAPTFIFGWARKNFSLPKQKLFPAEVTYHACVCVLGQFTKKSLLLARVKAV